VDEEPLCLRTTTPCEGGLYVTGATKGEGNLKATSHTSQEP
jgi:hypothetical protein